MNMSSNYPISIDDRIFFQDINIEQIPQLTQYQKYISEYNFKQASNIINNSDINFFSASLLNYFDEKLFNIENEVVRKEKIIDNYKEEAKNIASKLYLTFYGSEPVDGLENNITWIS